MAKKNRKKKHGYLEASRRLSASYVFVAPLFALYQAGILLDPSAGNGTAPIYQELLDRFHGRGLIAISVALLGLLCLAIWRTRSRRIRVPGLYAGMFLESLLWGIGLLIAAHFFPFQSLSIRDHVRDLTSGIGAGIYEETLFRFLLMGGLLMVLQRGLGGSPYWVVPLAIVVSAALFSQAHHALGGEPWTLRVFAFRAAMGAILGWIFYARGLGIVVYTHAIYNVSLTFA